MNITEFEQLKRQSVGHALIKAARLHKEYSFNVVKQKLGQTELRPSHLELMPFIDFKGDTIVSISKKAQISKQAVSVLVNDLTRFGVLKKIPNPKDRRSQMICFNLESKKSLFTGFMELKNLDKKINELLGEKETKKLLISLNKIIDLYQED